MRKGRTHGQTFDTGGVDRANLWQHRDTTPLPIASASKKLYNPRPFRIRTIGELYELIEKGIADLPNAIVGDPLDASGNPTGGWTTRCRSRQL